ncbi:MAG: 50S ribosomal protein L10 [Candidatus Eisenbacteria sp.]|nr:50S ribosomal protein L10 [Candidatus Eisenbacteria bacterium]
MPTPEKEAVVQELAALFRESQGVYLTDFTGLDVAAMGVLRQKCRKNGVKFRVVKNRLAKLAVVGTEAENLLPFLTGPIGIAVAEDDPAVPARVLKEFVDEYERPEIKVGLIEGRVVEAEAIWRIARLPSHEVLLAQFMGALQSPLRDMMWGLKSVGQGFVRALAAIQEQKQAQESGQG